MADVSIKLVGVDKLVAQLGKLSGLDLRATMGQAAGIVENSAKSLVPVDSGALRSSIHGRVTYAGTMAVGIIATSLEYAPFVEFGTGTRGGSEAASKLGITFGERAGQVAQPYMFPALLKNVPRIRALFVSELQKALRSN